jgi:hypothetical protein
VVFDAWASPETVRIFDPQPSTVIIFRAGLSKRALLRSSSINV